MTQVLSKTVQLAVALLATVGPCWAIGPSYDCNAVATPLAQFICANPNLSRMDLEFVQAYYALRQQVGSSGWKPLKLEAIDFQNRVDVLCSIAPSGTLPSGAAELATCLEKGYEEQRANWASRLTGPALDEVNRPIEQHVALQRDLQTLGFLSPSATIDGVYGEATRAAILEWQHSRNLPETAFIGAADGTALEAQAAGSVAMTQPALTADQRDKLPPAPPTEYTCQDLVMTYAAAKPSPYVASDEQAKAKFHLIIEFEKNYIVTQHPNVARHIDEASDVSEALGEYCGATFDHFAEPLSNVIDAIISARGYGP